MIPPFGEDGNLPPGVHWATWEEFVDRFGLSSNRPELLDGLQRALEGLSAAGCETVYIDGSFVTTEILPNDIDVVWKTQGVNFQVLDPIFNARGVDRAIQFERFRCELFSSDIAEATTRMTYLEYFQRDTSGNAKGIIALDIRRLPW